MKDILSTLYMITIGSWKIVFQHLTGNYKRSPSSGFGSSIELLSCYGITIINLLLLLIVYLIL